MAKHAGMAYVTIRIKGEEGYHRTVLGKDRCIIGRSSSCDVPINHPSLSREHCAVTKRGDGWVVEDLGSANGTWLGKEKLVGPLPVEEKSIIKAGKARLTFHVGEIPAAAIEEPVAAAEAEDEPGELVMAGDPKDAHRCPGCSMWLSTAHRSAKEAWNCPRCGRAQSAA